MGSLVQEFDADLTLIKQGALVIDTSAYAQTSYAREPESAVSVSSTFVHEPISAAYTSIGSTTYTYDQHSSHAANDNYSQELSRSYAQETSPFAHEQSPSSSAVPLTPASHVRGFAPAGYVVPSQGFPDVNGGYHIDHSATYSTPVTTGMDFAGPTAVMDHAGMAGQRARDLSSNSAGTSAPVYPVYAAARKYSVDSSSHASFGSPEIVGQSYGASSSTFANGQVVDSAGFLLTSTLAQPQAYEYQYPSPPGTAQSQGHTQYPAILQPPHINPSQTQPVLHAQPHFVPAHTPVHSRQRSASTSSFAGISYGLPPSFYEEVEEKYDSHEVAVSGVSAEPSFAFTRQTWWDGLLSLYSSSQAPLTLNLGASMSGSDPTQGQLGLGGRRAARAAIMKDVKFLFAVAPHWLFFLHVPTFYASLSAPERACPALVLAVCAISALFQGSEAGDGAEGRRRALKLRDEAQGALEAALSSRSISEELAGAAWILAFFEQCCHPAHQHGRVRSALHVLDGLMQHLRLSALDAGDPTASGYARGEVPVVRSGIEEIASDGMPARTSPPRSISHQHQHQGPALHEHLFPQRQRQSPPTQSTSAQAHRHSPGQRGCSCDELTLGRVDPGAAQHTPFWVTSPAWQNDWSSAEVRREGCRRLAWSAMTLAAAYSSYAAASGYGVPELSLLEPGNFNLLFPGEALGTGKRSVWALYLRAMLLWLACLRMRSRVEGRRRRSIPNESSVMHGYGVYDGGHSGEMQDSEIAAFAMKAWLETEAIEKALNVHTCSVEPAMLYHGREYLFNTRMCISFEFRRFIPHVMTGVGREKSEEWLRDQGRRAKMAAHSLQAVSGSRGHTLAHRPHFVWWFMGQVRRALHLWSLDNSLTIALDVCRDFMMPIAHLSNLFPCVEQRIKFEELQGALNNATIQASQSGYVVRTS
ncbi:unnamed protein product [Peniophora sp. CBMAI 1063]|nr:unnamed protein product [Peniophora sp. CBMAI 1063]